MPRFKSLALGAGLLGSLLCFAHAGSVHAEAVNAAISAGTRSLPPEQRVALVIGNARYESAPPLANPNNDARSMAQLLGNAGFEVTAVTDLKRSDMLKAVEDFSSRVADRGPNTVAMIYYAGHGVQVAGENYLLPVDARISAPTDLDDNSLRLVDLMGTLETIESRARIVVLDACRNNPFPGVNEASRGLAIVDAPNNSIVGYSTAPGMEALDGDGNHSPYTAAFLNIAREPNLPIEQLFKRVRLAVNNATNGRQTPWESSSLKSDFYFFGDTAVAASRPPVRGAIIQLASDLPSRSVRQAYDYVLSEGTPEHYEEFIQMYPQDPLTDRIRVLLNNWRLASAWRKAVVTNTPSSYRSFQESWPNSPYARTAVRLQAEPRDVPVMQFTRLWRPGPRYGYRMNAMAYGNHAHLPSRLHGPGGSHRMSGQGRFNSRFAPHRPGGMGHRMHTHPGARFGGMHARGSFGGRPAFGGGRMFGGGRSFAGGGFGRGGFGGGGFGRRR